MAGMRGRGLEVVSKRLKFGTRKKGELKYSPTVNYDYIMILGRSPNL
jgi:hypothetical protein